MHPYSGKPNVLDTFSGAGGMSAGFRRAGFRVGWHVECDPLSAATLMLNEPESQTYIEDVRLYLSKVENRKVGYPSSQDTENVVHHVHASSPCQGFSMVRVHSILLIRSRCL